MSAVGAAEERRGWRARLELVFELRDKRTRLVHRHHEGPLLVQKALYPEPGAPCHVCVVHPPGGVASGDDLELKVDVGAAAHTVLTTPASGKFYRRGLHGLARSSQLLSAQHATLEWLPQENIFYPDAAAELHTHVKLRGTSRFIGWELACLGMPARAATLGKGAVRTRFEVWRDGKPVLLERLALDAVMQAATWGMGGHSTLGTAVFLPACRADLEVANAVLSGHCDGMTVACTLVDEVLVCRGLAQRADRLRGVFVHLWSALRPRLLGRAAVAPRIWAT